MTKTRGGKVQRNNEESTGAGTEGLKGEAPESNSRERQREPESNDTRCEAPESSSAFLLTKMESDGRFSVAECPYPI